MAEFLDTYLFSDEEMLCRVNRKKDEAYEDFVEKFKAKKTTDDCYTPPRVYNEVLAFVRETWPETTRAEIVRPFYPGRDYTKEAYPEGSVVVDNPPFSILAKIIRFYCAHNIRFFLFAPSLTLFTAPDCDLTYLVTDSHVIYENGAVVATGFITNLPSSLRVWLCPQLNDRIKAVQKAPAKEKKVHTYSANVISAAVLTKIVARGIELRVPKAESAHIREMNGKSIFGGGYLISSRLAAERLAAERAKGFEYKPGAGELAIIAELDRNGQGDEKVDISGD